MVKGTYKDWILFMNHLSIWQGLKMWRCKESVRHNNWIILRHQIPHYKRIGGNLPASVEFGRGPDPTIRLWRTNKSASRPHHTLTWKGKSESSAKTQASHILAEEQVNNCASRHHIILVNKFSNTTRPPLEKPAKWCMIIAGREDPSNAKENSLVAYLTRAPARNLSQLCTKAERGWSRGLNSAKPRTDTDRFRRCSGYTRRYGNHFTKLSA
jgi:hypothetical protein